MCKTMQSNTRFSHESGVLNRLVSLLEPKDDVCYCFRGQMKAPRTFRRRLLGDGNHEDCIRAQFDICLAQYAFQTSSMDRPANSESNGPNIVGVGAAQRGEKDRGRVNRHGEERQGQRVDWHIHVKPCLAG
jgi:hypothetical protein